MRKIKIGKRLIMSFAIIVLLMVVSAIYSTYMLFKMVADTDEMFTYYVEPLEPADTASSSVNYLMALVRQAYIINSDAEAYKSTVAQIESLRNDITTSLNNYKDIIDNDPHVTETDIQLTNSIFAKWDEYRATTETIISYLDAKDVKKAEQIFLDPAMRQAAVDLSDLLYQLFKYNMDSAVEKNSQQTSDSYITIFAVIAIAMISVIAAVIIAILLIVSITKPVKELRDAMNEVAEGNLDLNINSNVPDEIGELTRYTHKVIGVVNDIIKSINKLSKENKEDGDIDARIDATRFKGAYFVVAEGVNSLTETLINDTLSVLNAMEAFGNGNFDIDIPKLPGKKIVLNKAVDGMRANLKSVTSEINSLVGGASRGNLKDRIDISSYKGDWAEIMNILNKLMEAIALPIQEVSEVMAYVSAGNFSNMMKGDYQGEFLAIKNSVNDTVTNMSSYISEISKILTDISDKDLDKSISREYVGEFSNIKNAINNITDTLSRIINDILSASGQVSSGAKQISESSMTLATGATEQASSVEELNATILTINENTRTNAENAKNAEGLSEDSKKGALKGNNDMNNMLKAMSGIEESSNSIAKIIKVIDDIAFQTNLLALNAAVEAARAGEHGKGFAVVAEEVRNLAGRSQTAAGETAGLIEESITRVKEGSEIASETASALQDIVENVTKVSTIITSISAASGEQAEAISQVSDGMTQIAQVVQNNSATSEESASASQELSSQAELLQNLVSEFNLKRL